MAHRHSPIRIALILPTLLLIGAGCGSSEQGSVSTSTEQAIIKAPASEIALRRQALEASPAVRACESRGFSVVARFDAEASETIEYCQFDDGSECRLDEYTAGTCGPGQGAAILTNSNLITDPFVESTCDEASPPVCGVNGHSYDNACIAAQSGIEIAREGLCSAEEIAANNPTIAPKNNARTNVISTAKSYISNRGNEPTIPPVNDDPAVAAQGKNPAWLASVIALIEGRGPTVPRTYINICSLGNTTVYLQTNGTNDLPSTLYNEQGEILCNPNRDFAGRCPSNGVPTGCERVYTDTTP